MANTKVIDEVLKYEMESDKAQIDIKYMENLKLLKFLNNMVKFYGDGDLDDLVAEMEDEE